ncbi:MAG: hypothetical protein JOZ17_06520 [Acetobacteraceae bacterium]|nr:hypothetical protein [Acetobacteraceae bacterium]
MFLLNQDNAKFELFRSSHDLTFIYGENDLAGYYGCGGQTIYDYGTGTHLQFSELTSPIKVYGLEHDAAAVIDLFNAVPATSLHPDGQGGTMLGAIDFVGATLAASQVHFLFSDLRSRPGALCSVGPLLQGREFDVPFRKLSGRSG